MIDHRYPVLLSALVTAAAAVSGWDHGPLLSQLISLAVATFGTVVMTAMTSMKEPSPAARTDAGSRDPEVSGQRLSGVRIVLWPLLVMASVLAFGGHLFVTLTFVLLAQPKGITLILTLSMLVILVVLSRVAGILLTSDRRFPRIVGSAPVLVSGLSLAGYVALSLSATRSYGYTAAGRNVVVFLGITTFLVAVVLTSGLVSPRSAPVAEVARLLGSTRQTWISILPSVMAVFSSLALSLFAYGPLAAFFPFVGITTIQFCCAVLVTIGLYLAWYCGQALCAWTLLRMRNAALRASAAGTAWFAICVGFLAAPEMVVGPISLDLSPGAALSPANWPSVFLGAAVYIVAGFVMAITTYVVSVMFAAPAKTAQSDGSARGSITRVEPPAS